MRDIIWQTRRQGPVNVLVISIEPGSLFICEQVADHRRSIDVAERQVLKTQPRTEFIGTGIHAEEQALVSDAMHTFPVNTRFIGRYHPREKRLGIEIVPDFLRAFMDIQEKTYSVSCAVPEITLVFPERSTCRIIYLTT